MNKSVRLLVEAEAYGKLVIDPNFYSKADGYIQRYFSKHSFEEQLTIESYLTQAAVRIARSEGKSRLEGEDFKAAVWLFHQPEQPDDPCEAAGRSALATEKARVSWKSGLLLESFAKNLNQQLKK
jgi:hypothetical protein